MSAEICAGDTLLAAADAPIASLPFDRSRRTSLFRLPFEIDNSSLEKKPVQLRVLSSWLGGYGITGVLLAEATGYCARPPRLVSIFFERLRRSESGWAMSENGEYRVGCIAYSPTVGLRAGAYRVSYRDVMTFRKGLSQIPEGVPVVVIVRPRKIIQSIAAGRVKPGLASTSTGTLYSISQKPRTDYIDCNFPCGLLHPLRLLLNAFCWIGPTLISSLQTAHSMICLPLYARPELFSTDRLKSLR